MNTLERNAQIIKMAQDPTVKLKDIASTFGLSSGRVCKILTSAGQRRNVTVPRALRPVSQRDLEIRALRETGLTLDAIAAKFNLSRERVRQIALQ